MNNTKIPTSAKAHTEIRPLPEKLDPLRALAKVIQEPPESPEA